MNFCFFTRRLALAVILLFALLCLAGLRGCGEEAKLNRALDKMQEICSVSQGEPPVLAALRGRELAEFVCEEGLRVRAERLNARWPRGRIAAAFPAFIAQARRTEIFLTDRRHEIGESCAQTRLNVSGDLGTFSPYLSGKRALLLDWVKEKDGRWRLIRVDASGE